MKHRLRILFILRFRQTSGGMAYGSSGLLNSARFVANMLRDHGIDVHLVQVIDSNDIDREVFKYKPTHVILEAIWVPPIKFRELTKLHPRVIWAIRVHSELPFIANEGMAIEWITESIKYPNVYVVFNNARALRDFRSFLPAHKTFYLPNYYPIIHRIGENKRPNHILDVGCLGAIRPMKNQLNQAVASIEYANQVGKRLRFHVNGRLEQGGEEVLKNLRALFDYTGHELVVDPWENHADFVTTLKRLDIGLQVSFSETFSIVTADMVTSKVPVVTSPEIIWVNGSIQAKPNDVNDIVAKMHKALGYFENVLVGLNLAGLRKSNKAAIKAWLGSWK